MEFERGLMGVGTEMWRWRCGDGEEKMDVEMET